MEPHLSTTPFGRRTLTLAHVACQALAKSRPPDKAVHKWNVFRAICSAKMRIGVSERALSGLNALLSFHPETVLSGAGLIVFPSNASLSLRAHGMAPATLRRHLAVLVDAGLIIRRDSPNGKRYARKGRGGELEQAFGFDLSPLVCRAEEFESLAEEVRAEERALKFLREKITLCRRDIAKMIVAGIEEGVSTSIDGGGPSGWHEVHTLYRGIVSRIPRSATQQELEPMAQELSLLADEVENLLERHINLQNLSANESRNERHKQNSKPNSPIDLEPGLTKKAAVKCNPLPQPPEAASSQKSASQEKPGRPEGAWPLKMVLEACPDAIDYARGGDIANWRDFLGVAEVIRPMLGISPSAWEAAQAAMGEGVASIVLACLLQKGSAIVSPGGYLRDLTRKAEANEFSVGPMLMALLAGRKKEKLRA